MKKLILILFGICSFLIVEAQHAKHIEVYLIGGQSNATGQGYVNNMSDSMKIDTSVLIFHSGKPHLNSGLPPYHWYPLHPASESPDRFGPELGFGTKLHQLRPNTSMVIIKHAHSGTDLYRQWNPGQNNLDILHWGDQFSTFVQTVNAGLDSLRKLGYKPVIKGMLWQQGENDADKGDTISALYGVHLNHFIKRVRQQFHARKILFVYGYVYPPPNSGKGITEVRQAEHDIDQNARTPLSVKRAFVVPTDDLSQRADDPHTPYPKDRLHFGTKGTWELGLRMAEKMNENL
ncbi:protein of unknown function (DUF303) [Mucilaginibacter yixingensis]|uniref:Sialate O-acetylesterase domain-containing protein n=1 Tax=Mucilaginibacter yixingensis TaxID=1295612 RepID=A0A2T5J929_9SPHI|nr:sialate O-acetylesterase [Mucilaginibacter yixingensis]PTQ96582.1 protein of unknown function (DUF303) [Mucilaginibacter yixingensis]